MPVGSRGEVPVRGLGASFPGDQWSFYHRIAVMMLKYKLTLIFAENLSEHMPGSIVSHSKTSRIFNVCMRESKEK